MQEDNKAKVRKVKNAAGDRSGGKADRSAAHFKTKIPDENKDEYGSGLAKKTKAVEIGKIEKTIGKREFEKSAIKSRKDELRRKKNPEKFDLAKKLKTMWDQVRRQQESKGEHGSEGVCDLASLVKGHAAELASAHDTSRVLQTLLKYGTANNRNELFEEIKPAIVTLLQQKYSRHYVLKVLRYGSDTHRRFIIGCIIGNTNRLLRSVYASIVVDTAFLTYATPSERRRLLANVYGPRFRMLCPSGDESIEAVFNRASSDDKTATLRYLKKTLLAFATRQHGRLLGYSIVQTALRDFFCYCDSTDDKAEIVEAVKEHMIQLTKHKSGLQCAVEVLRSTKSSKSHTEMLKKLQPDVKSKLLSSQEGSVLVLAICETVENFAAVQKYILAPIFDDMDAAFDNAMSFRILLYLVSPRDSHYFPPKLVQSFADAESGLARVEALRRECKVDSKLLSILSQHGKISMKIGVDVENSQLLAVSTMLNALIPVDESEKQMLCESFKNFVGMFAQSASSLESNPAIGIALKTLISGDKKRSSDLAFSTILVNAIIATSKLDSWLQSNRACFVLVHLCESAVDGVLDKLKEAVKPFKKLLAKQLFSAASILSGKLC